jgi:medium-chain acyl-[acyl-carrier-protein] hydrolase
LFRSWRDLLPEDIDVYAVQLPGREGRIDEEPVSRMTDLVPMVYSALEPHLHVPFAIFGHSMGGLLGFELARHLRRAGARQPSHLFVSAARPPHVPDRDLHHELPDLELLAALRTMSGYPRAVLDNRKLMALLLPTIRADAAITETYRYVNEGPLSCAMTMFAGRDDVQVPLEEVRGWTAYTTGPSILVTCPGGHDFLMTAATTVIYSVAGRLLEGEVEPPLPVPVPAPSVPALLMFERGDGDDGSGAGG